MMTYKAYFETEHRFAIKKINADTPEQALEEAKRIATDKPDSLDYCAFSYVGTVRVIEICDDKATTLGAWRDDELILRLAARDLLEALEQAVQALNTADSDESGQSFRSKADRDSD